jgi:hypothetical protein
VATGRKERVMIVCATFETTKITDAVRFYDATKVHIIHYVRDPEDPKSNVYIDFYNRVCEIIGRYSENIEIVEHNEKVSDFTVMLRTVLKIIEEEKEGSESCDIYVNISAGTSEYAAASAIASMMNPGTIPFSVSTEEYTVQGTDQIKQAYYIDDRPVGLTKTVHDPKVLPNYLIEMPEEHLVRALRVLDRRNKSRLPTSSRYMVQALKDAGIWYRDTDTDDLSRKPKQHQSEAVYYHRDYVRRWEDMGWVEKDTIRNRFVLTEDGRTVIDTFHTEEPEKSMVLI